MVQHSVAQHPLRTAVCRALTPQYTIVSQLGPQHFLGMLEQYLVAILPLSYLTQTGAPKAPLKLDQTLACTL